MSSASRAPRVALIDLGDTLCDCSTAVDTVLSQTGPDNSTPLDAQRQAITRTPGFWRQLAPSPLGFELLRLLRREGLVVNIVTKGPREAPQVWADKAAWCHEHLPDVPLVITDDKALIPGDVLVEDWLPYVDRWQTRWQSGLAIVVAKPWNTDAVEGSKLIRYDGTNRVDVERRLRLPSVWAARGND